MNGKDADKLSTGAAAFEKHYRISELARIWGLGRETYSVPESVARRIHTRLLHAA